MRKSNYDKQPATRIAGQLWKGWQAVRDEINRRCASLVGKKSVVVVVECYQGVHHEELTRELSALNPSLWVDTQSVFKSATACSDIGHILPMLISWMLQK